MTDAEHIVMKQTRTGRTRHRLYKRWFGEPLLVLQLEYRCQGVDLKREGGQFYEKPYDFLIWEDATPCESRLSEEE
jgi:hypothetical protein